MIVYHITPIDCLKSILRWGLRLPSREPRRIWLTTNRRTCESLIAHVAKHHHCKLTNLIVFRLQVDPSKLTLFKGARKGIATCKHRIPPSCIVDFWS